MSYKPGSFFCYFIFIYFNLFFLLLIVFVQRGKFENKMNNKIINESISFPGFSPTRPTVHSVGRVGENPGNEVVNASVLEIQSTPDNSNPR